MTKPVLSDPIALRIPEDILKDIETIAKVSERSRSWVIVRALKYYLMQEGNDILQIMEGEEQIRNGEVIDAEDLFAELLSPVQHDAA
ncbi:MULTISPECIES: CopG family ribbon-helix-helix protein [Rhizobium]|uniref:Ribbon-helix-helix protein, CopG family n=1 Tax=Rhizobium rhododendri TaxID=2506430 RepID=A0ABY8IIQ9_9HYPH|nr:MULTISPECIES: ribbon-helix-helix protein, CopG family [Rhizobium]MBO9097822.1 ribbon-helix-helix protein, CopG family [Rhizobium sp. L58/93]MBO9133396.1 ribbon-helix-helix protein, CopG family [Rhizobium sp. B209b/85]MBO9167973.1 ribbon-helix-helix protein, CopG family [Rhizobium sp. L245/93]MBO9184018.1 ribbon-helix-helix protein, CopG family [Rhizobium sp. E27B/91]MBZ5761708.1 ribbon-helix-helix domain-containing protein [Rhizobium sp. VS19-DR96]